MRSVYETERSEPFAFAFRPAWEAGLFLKPCKAGKRCVLEEVFIVFFLTVLWSYYSDDFCFFSLSKSYNRLIAWSKKPLLQGPFGIFYRRCRVFFFYYWKKRVHLCTFFLQSWRNVDQELLAHISEKKEGTITSLNDSQKNLRSLVPKNLTFQSSVFWDRDRNICTRRAVPKNRLKSAQITDFGPKMTKIR